MHAGHQRIILNKRVPARHLPKSPAVPLLQHNFQDNPLLGYIFIAGSLSYSFYSILKNKMNSSGQKLRDLSQLAIIASTSVGTSIAGGIIGQMLIPIPVVGALIGTAIGGFLGERGTRKLTNFY